MGALIANTQSITGNGKRSLHYDEALNKNGGSSSVGKLRVRKLVRSQFRPEPRHHLLNRGI